MHNCRAFICAGCAGLFAAAFFEHVSACALLQVVSEAAEAAAKGILRHCHAPRLVPCVCDIMTGDKNAKLRGHCSKLLLQVRTSRSTTEHNRAVNAAVQVAQQCNN